MVGNLLREHRAAAGLTQRKLARKARVAQRTVYAIESGCRSRLDTKRRILKALGMTWEQREKVWPAGSKS